MEAERTESTKGTETARDRLHRAVRDLVAKAEALDDKADRLISRTLSMLDRALEVRREARTCREEAQRCADAINHEGGD